MGFTRKIKYYLVHTHKFGNKQAQALLEKGAVTINGNVVFTNIELKATDEVKLNDSVLQQQKSYRYFKYHKPVGLVSSLNGKVENSLYEVYKELMPLYIAGRLDKNSEGLMLLSDNGKWVKELTDPESLKEKVYEVRLNKRIDDVFIDHMKRGVDIKFYTTKACDCLAIDEYSFKITLTEGKNKQIRRMCKTLGYQVVKLKRIQIDHILLDKLKSGSYEMLNI